jgi:hypothetical protein
MRTLLLGEGWNDGVYSASAPNPSPRLIASCFALFVLVWTLYGMVEGVGKSIHGDLAEAYAWGREFQLGYHQHPPLWAWAAGAWFRVFPHQDWAFRLLAIINAAVGLLGSWFLIGRFAKGWERIASAALLLVVPFYTFLGFKYNANAAFLSLWPWTLYAFVRAVEGCRAGDALLFGVLAAASLLSKYYAVVLLITCFAASLAHPNRRAYYRSASPYISIVTCTVLCLPHAVWLLRAGAPPLSYALSRTGYGLGRAVLTAIELPASIAAYHVVVVAILLVASRGPNPLGPRPRRGSLERLCLDILVAAPIVLTMLFGIALELKLSVAMMIGCFPLLPLLLLERMPPADPRRVARLAVVAAAAVAAGALLLSPPIAYLEFALTKRLPTASAVSGPVTKPTYLELARTKRLPPAVVSDSITEPNRELAEAATELWRKEFGTPLRIVGGSMPYDTLTGFYSSDSPSVFIGLDWRKAPWITPERIADEGLLALCKETDLGCAENVAPLLTPETRRQTLAVHHELWGIQQPTMVFDAYIVPPAASSNPPLVAAAFPAGRSAEVGSSVTAFATITNTGASTAIGCAIAPSATVKLPSNFSYQTTDPATNTPTGTANTPVDIPAGAPQSFVITETPTKALPTLYGDFLFVCANAKVAPQTNGLNTLSVSVSVATAPVPDVVALAASDDPGFVDIPGATGNGVFAFATINLGTDATITASANTGATNLPVTLTLCQTDSTSGACLAAPAPGVTADMVPNAISTFAIFVTGSAAVADMPGVNRVFVTFTDAAGVLRGETSVAVRTQ